MSCREAWARIECWVSRASAARATLAELEATLEAQLRQRDRAAAEPAPGAPAAPATTALLAYLREAIADTQHQIMQIEVLCSTNVLQNHVIADI